MGGNGNVLLSFQRHGARGTVQGGIVTLRPPFEARLVQCQV